MKRGIKRGKESKREIYFNDITNCLRLFYAKRLGNCIYIYIFLYGCFL